MTYTAEFGLGPTGELLRRLRHDHPARSPVV